MLNAYVAEYMYLVIIKAISSVSCTKADVSHYGKPAERLVSFVCQNRKIIDKFFWLAYR